MIWLRYLGSKNVYLFVCLFMECLFSRVLLFWPPHDLSLVSPPSLLFLNKHHNIYVNIGHTLFFIFVLSCRENIKHWLQLETFKMTIFRQIFLLVDEQHMLLVVSYQTRKKYSNQWYKLLKYYFFMVKTNHLFMPIWY